MRYWWVNQNKTYQIEVKGGFLWSPKTRKGGLKNYFYDTMTFVRPGDIVFSFFKTRIQAVGVVQRSAMTAPKPAEFGAAGVAWDSTGWLVDVEFIPCQTPFRPKDVIEHLRQYLPAKYSPLLQNGNGVQNLYLTEIQESFAFALLAFGGMGLEGILHQLAPIEDPVDEAFVSVPPLQDAPKFLDGDPVKIQEVEARRGQGIFKHNLRLIESQCRLTGVKNLRHLRASHIKPWSKSTDSEKVDGANGLLLSPHVDHLFDRGFISFKNNGEILRSPVLDPVVMVQWSLDKVESAGSFNSEQSDYLEYHRDSIFRASV